MQTTRELVLKFAGTHSQSPTFACAYADTECGFGRQDREAWARPPRKKRKKICDNVYYSATAILAQDTTIPTDQETGITEVYMLAETDQQCNIIKVCCYSTVHATNYSMRFNQPAKGQRSARCKRVSGYSCCVSCRHLHAWKVGALCSHTSSRWQ